MCCHYHPVICSPRELKKKSIRFRGDYGFQNLSGVSLARILLRIASTFSFLFLFLLFPTLNASSRPPSLFLVRLFVQSGMSELRQKGELVAPVDLVCIIQMREAHPLLTIDLPFLFPLISPPYLKNLFK